MILVLDNGDHFSVDRETCGHQYRVSATVHGDDWVRVWDIDPVRVLSARNGFFVIADYGTTANDPVDILIPVRSVSYIIFSSKGNILPRRIITYARS